MKDNNPYEIDALIKAIESYRNIFGFCKYTEKERKYILNRITNSIRRINDPCMDNFRFSDGTHISKNDYMKQRETGCCGFWDEEIKLKSGKIFIFGFNYGH